MWQHIAGHVGPHHHFEEMIVFYIEAWIPDGLVMSQIQVPKSELELYPGLYQSVLDEMVRRIDTHV